MYEGQDAFKQVTMRSGETYNNKFGAFDHSELIGQVEYGSKVFAKNLKGWMYVLRPTSALYTQSLAQRTQILYTPDISMVLARL